METWKIITNVILTLIILALTVVVIVDYVKHKDDETISFLPCLLPSVFSTLISAGSLSDKFVFIGQIIYLNKIECVTNGGFCAS